jgi:hypothetical protein
VCDDTTSSTLDLCNGLDDDCDAASADGFEDPAVGEACDGPDSDLCLEGTSTCSGGSLVCDDTTSSTLDLCNGLDDDCDAASADGSEDPAVGAACDGPDSDLCLEGTSTCSGGSLVCDDATDSTVDLCNGLDDDCDAASADGSEDPAVGAACDGPDSDLCLEGTSTCSGGSLTCGDATDNSVEVCNGVDDDCNSVVDDGGGALCDDSNVCTTDACSGTSGCVYTNNTAPCTDNDACTTGDVCGSGSCQPGAPVDCNDNNVCTDDSCNPATGCVYVNNSVACDDGNACTTSDTCNGGSCVGADGPAPAEVQGVTIATRNPTKLTWTDLSGLVFDIVSSTLSELSLNGTATATCLTDDVSPAKYVDVRPDPPQDDGYYYLVRAQGTCGSGTYGYDTAGLERIPTAACQ